jgi:endonuclease/exonuclease/phosphatase (EEP) superfamily protein YafD
MKSFSDHLRTFSRTDASPSLALILLTGVLCPFFAPMLNGCDSFICWTADLATHWQWVYLTAALWLLARTVGLAQKIAIVAAMLAAWNLGSNWTPLETPKPNQEVFRVIQANVNVANPSPAKLLAWVRAEKPDVLVVEEVSREWASRLEWVPGYPYRQVLPSSDSFGIAVLSRHPMRVLSPATAATRDAMFKTTDIDVEVEWKGERVRVLATHPMPPIRSYLDALRDKYLAESARSLGDSNDPSLLVGDFNATPWSGAAVGIRRAGLDFSSALIPTWPTMFGVFAVIPIDHVVINKRWGVANRQRGPDIGSDHFPIMVDLILKPR